MGAAAGCGGIVEGGVGAAAGAATIGSGTVVEGAGAAAATPADAPKGVAGEGAPAGGERADGGDAGLVATDR